MYICVCVLSSYSALIGILFKLSPPLKRTVMSVFNNRVAFYAIQSLVNTNSLLLNQREEITMLECAVFELCHTVLLNVSGIEQLVREKKNKRTLLFYMVLIFV